MTMTLPSPPSKDAFPPPDIHEADRLYETFQAIEKSLNQHFLGNAKAIRLALTTFLAAGFPLLQGPTGTGKSFFLRLLARQFGLAVDFISPIAHTLLDPARSQMSQGTLFPFVEDTFFVAQNVLFFSHEMILELTQKLRSSNARRTDNQEQDAHYNFFAATQDISPRDLDDSASFPLLNQFMANIPFTYPDDEVEKAIILGTTGIREKHNKKKHELKELLGAQEFVRRIPIGESILDALQNLLRSLRPQSTKDPLIKHDVEYGPNTHALYDFVMMVRAYALLSGRLAPTMQDIHELAIPTLSHRIFLKENTQSSPEEYVKRSLERLCP